MRKTFVIAAVACLLPAFSAGAVSSSVSAAVTVSVAKDSEDKVFSTPEQPPTFPGGEAALMKYIAENIHYPAVAAENNIEGRVIVKFVVRKDGSVGNAVIARSVDPSLDKEALRVIRSLPKFEPGKMNGQPVNVWYVLPISFKLPKL